MKEVEEQIIAACLFEEKFKEVSFLEPEDFTTANAKECYKLIQENKVLDIYRLLAKKKLPVSCQYWMLSLEYSIVGYEKHKDLSLFMVEERFKRLLIKGLTVLSSSTKSSLERELLGTLILAIPDENIFDLSDSAVEYLGTHASDYTKNRIESFLTYRNNRLKEIKKVSNECS